MPLTNAKSVTVRRLLLPLLLCIAPFVSAETRDALAPKSAKADALALPLHTITVATANLEASRLFYGEGLGLTFSEPLTLSKRQRAQLASHWSLPADLDWELYHLSRPGAEGAANIRLLVVKRITPTIHRSWNALELGPFSMGFPNEHQAQLDTDIRRLGFGALNEIEIYPVPRTDGTTYQIFETIFNGPEFVHAVGIQRGDGMAQLGPIDSSGMGGPAYSAQVVTDSDKVLDFYQSVLGMELRSDRHWKSAGTKGALNVPDGTEFRFSIVYSKGATSGHLLFVDYMNRQAIDTGVAPRLPNRGIAMWSFPVTNLDQVLANAEQFGAEVYSAPALRDFPILGKARSASLLAPNGFVVEIFEVTK